MLTRFITSRIVLVLELINDFWGITLYNWPARGINYSHGELHYISRSVGDFYALCVCDALPQAFLFWKKWRSWDLYALCVCDALPQALFFRKKWRSWIFDALCVCDALPQALFFWKNDVPVSKLHYSNALPAELITGLYELHYKTGPSTELIM